MFCIQGGPITYSSPVIPQVNTAVAAFSKSVKDPKAAILVTYNVVAGQASDFSPVRIPYFLTVDISYLSSLLRRWLP